MSSSRFGYGGVKMKRSLTLIAILFVALFGFTWAVVSAQRTGGYREREPLCLTGVVADQNSDEVHRANE